MLPKEGCMYTNKLILLALLTIVNSLGLAVVEYPTDVSTMSPYQSFQTVPGDNPNASPAPSSPYESFNKLPSIEDNYIQTNDFYYGTYPYYYYSYPYSYYNNYPYYYPYYYQNYSYPYSYQGNEGRSHHRFFFGGHSGFEHRGGEHRGGEHHGGGHAGGEHGGGHGGGEHH